MNDMEFVDVSDGVKTKDKFMIGIYVSIVVLIILAILIYFFGYDVLKPFIRV